MNLTCKATLLATGIAVAMAGGAANAATLGAFTFDDNLFGNTLTESDGGTHSAINWLNVANADPGNPAYLTGANFDTGIANIGFGNGPVSYTIGYTSGITNGAGDDFGVVVARYSTDPFTIEFSLDGVIFSAPAAIVSATAVATGVGKNYFYGGGGPFAADLFVHALDFSSFGIAAGASVKAIRITGNTELDLIRVAGLGIGGVVPEPTTWALMIFGLGAVGAAMRRRRTVTASGTPALA